MRIRDWSSDVCSSDLYHADRRAGRVRQIASEQGAQGIAAGDAVLGEAAQVQLEAFRFDQLGRVGRYPKLGHRHPWFAAGIEPAQLVGVPDIHAVKRQRIGKAECGTEIGSASCWESGCQYV